MRALLIAVGISLAPVLSLAQPIVVQDPIKCVVWELGPTLNPGIPYDLTIRIANPEQIQDRCVMAISFVMTDGVQIADPSIDYHFGFDTLFGALPDFVVEHHGDTVVAALSVLATEPGRGLPVSSDSIGYFSFHFIAPAFGSEGEYLSIDTSSSSAYGGLQFGAGAAPVWDGWWSYRIFQPPDCGAQFTNCPGSVGATVCSPFTFQFRGVSCLGDSAILGFHLMSGPGEIDEATGVYTWTPGPADGGTIQTVEVEVDAIPCDAYPFTWGDGFPCEMQLTVTGVNTPPKFAAQQPRAFTVTTGESLVIQPQIEDPDACTDYRFSYYWSIEDPEPPGWLDTLTGEFHYEGTAADTNVYYFNIVVTEIDVADTMGFYIYHYDSYVCGNMNHLDGINVTDLTWLVGYLFQGGLPPVTISAGNVDCQTGVNVSDLTYMVAFLFQGGAAPCALCP